MHSGHEGWRLARLADTGEWLSGGTPSTTDPRFWGGEIPWISAASLKKFEVEESERRITGIAVSAGSRLVPAGTVLFVVRGMSLKSEFRVGVTRREVAFGQDCKAIIPIPEIDASYLAYSLIARHRKILSMVDEAGHGTGRLPTDQIGNLVIGIPDKAEQRRVVEVLASVEESIRCAEGLLTKIDHAEMALTEALISQSNQIGAIADLRVGMREYSHWPARSLGDLLIRIEAGRSPDLPDRPATYNEWGVLKVSAIRRRGLEENENKAVTRPHLADPRIEVRPGDLLISRANTSELVGLACYVGDVRPRLMLSDKTLRLVPEPSRANAEFIARALATRSARRQIENNGTGSSGSMKNISQDDIRSLLVPCPPVDQQRIIVARLKSIGARATAELRVLEKLRSLRRGLMADLLTGRVRVKDAEKVVEAVA